MAQSPGLPVGARPMAIVVAGAPERVQPNVIDDVTKSRIPPGTAGYGDHVTAPPFTAAEIKLENCSFDVVLFNNDLWNLPVSLNLVSNPCLTFM